MSKNENGSFLPKKHTYVYQTGKYKDPHLHKKICYKWFFEKHNYLQYNYFISQQNHFCRSDVGVKNLSKVCLHIKVLYGFKVSPRCLCGGFTN